MKIILRYTLLILTFGFMVNCEEDEVTRRNYPRLNTLSVSEITSEGARLNAKFIYRGNFEIINYGFVWGEMRNPSLENSDRTVFSENIQTNGFSSNVESSLKENTPYYVRAFAQTNEFIVYGENVSFLSLGSKAPVIDNFTPSTVYQGDTITIKGKYFSGLSSNNTVSIGEFETKVIESNDSTLLAIIPSEPLDIESLVSVTIAGNTSIASEKIRLKEISIESIIPSSAKSNDTIRINGQFRFEKDYSKILFSATSEFQEAKIIDVSDNEIKVVVPNSIIEGNIKLTIGNQSVTSSDFNYLKPTVLSSPSNGTWLEELTITGENFQTQNGLSEVYIVYDNANFLCEITNRSEESISFIIPLNADRKFGTLQLIDAGNEFNSSFSFKDPIIESITPENVDFGSTITVLGENFNPSNNEIILNVNGSRITTNSTFNSKNQLEFKIPDNVSTNDGFVDIRLITGNGLITEYNNTIKLNPPRINSISPELIEKVDDIVTISGSGFSPDISNNEILFNDHEMTILSASSNQMTAIINTGFIRDVRVSENHQNPLLVRSGGLSATSDINLEFNYKAPWTALRNPPSQINASGGSLDLVNNNIIALGGIYEFSPTTFNSDLFTYNNELDLWMVTQSVPQNENRRLSFSLATDDGYYWGIGISEAGLPLYDLHRLNNLTNEWESILSPITSSTSGKTGSKLAGFFDGNLNILDEGILYRYDASKDEWNIREQINYPEAHVSNGGVFAHSGFIYQNETYIILRDQSFNDLRKANMRFFKKTNDEWVEDGFLDKDYNWGNYFRQVDYQNQLFVASQYDLYQLNIQDYSLLRIRKPINLDNDNIRHIVKGVDGIYVLFRDGAFWRYDPSRAID